MTQDFDTMLEALKRNPVDTSRLRHLESDVWQRITARKMHVPWFERLLGMIFTPQYRLAPIALAAVIGITVGSATFSPARQAVAAEALNFNVFSSQSGYLVSSSLNRNLL